MIGAVFAEYSGSSEGLGNVILRAIPQLETSRAYAAVVLLAIVAMLLFFLLSMAERVLVPWARRTTEWRSR
jgi:ABC-type nitrate/sulfonate/bicarbonate transport system permease component